MPDLLRARGRTVTAIARALFVPGVCIGWLACSPSEPVDTAAAAVSPATETATETPSATDDAAGSTDDAALAYWMGVWKDVRHEDPMYLRLPPGVDTRGWDSMHAGFVEYFGRQKAFNRPTSDNYDRDYEFTWDPFTLNIPLWKELLEPFAGKPDVRYLEIGVAEGRSFVWTIDNILTHPTSRATGIDPFMVAEHEKLARGNIQRSSGPEKVTLIEGFSGDVLPDLEPDSFDIIYIDGSHLAGDVLLDSVYTWRLLRDGGIVIHDDYINKNDHPPDMHPLVSVDVFITAFRNTAEVLHRGHQIVLRKRALELPQFCWNRDPCLRIGNYLYAWGSDRLLHADSHEVIKISQKEAAVLKEILLVRRIGAEAELVLEEDVAGIRSRSPKVFARLEELLDLQVSTPARAAN